LIRIGTCGYTYSWIKAKPSPFKWYIDQHFNSVEINASFYRFPTESWIRTWQDNAPKDFTFSIKVHRSITHYTKLKGSKSIELWKRFINTLESVSDTANYNCFCSVSAPGLPNNIIATNDTIYLRLHGSKEWYNDTYTKKELDNVLLKTKKSKAKKKAIYLNNNHGMLKNGLYLLEKTQ
jgi:uncharacterized protein YecE (DUF72 family)